MDKVIFRKFKEGDVIALLPDVDANFGNIMSYQHQGQHSEASIEIIRYTKLTTPAEYKSLLSELKSIGYNPKVYKRLQYNWLNWQH
jgi:hypothetical protein